MQAWSAASGLTFEEAANPASADIQIGWGDFDTADSNVIGYTTLQQSGGVVQPGAIVRMEDPGETALVAGPDGQPTYADTRATLYQVALHEIGHALGLSDDSDPELGDVLFAGDQQPYVGQHRHRGGSASVRSWCIRGRGNHGATPAGNGRFRCADRIAAARTDGRLAGTGGRPGQQHHALIARMPPRIHLISGLPRSGSTLLSALLRQNPRFVAGVTSPVAMLCGNLLHSMSGGGEFASFFTDERRRAIVRGVFDSFYADVPEDRVVFDTNRTWTARLPLLTQLYPAARVICCVREVAWIIDSIERLVRKNALQPSKLFNYRTGGSIYSRVEILMDPEKGLVGLAWNSLREAWFSEAAERLIVVNYDSLARDPGRVMARLYEALGEPPSAHDFDNVAYDEPDYDADLGMPGLHRVRPKIAPAPRQSCLPPDLIAKYADVNFWLNPKLNHRKVQVL